jgi:Glycosyl transferases group 1
MKYLICLRDRAPSCSRTPMPPRAALPRWRSDSGGPAISTNVGGLPDMFCDGYNGLLVAPKDAEALAEAMSRLIANNDLRNRLTSGASDYGSTELSWDLIARQTSAVYESAIIGHRRSRSFAQADRLTTSHFNQKVVTQRRKSADVAKH